MKRATPAILVGTGAIAYSEWKGRFYPKDVLREKAFSFYARRFSALELNSTFYRMPSAADIKKIIAHAPPRFPIAVKAPGLLTHVKRLKNARRPLRQYLKALSAFGNHLGPALIQLPPNFKKDLPRLTDFLALIPRGFKIAVEFRHASWFEPEVFDALRKKRAALVFNDVDVDMPFVSTADWGYLRLRRLAYTDRELQTWREKIAGQQWKRAFVIFKHEEKATAPDLAKRFQGEEF